MGMKSDKLSDDACPKRVACQFFCNDAASLSSFKSKAGADRHYVTTERNNHLHASSSHDSSGNAKTKASLMVCDSFDGIAMLSEVATAQAAAAEEQLSFEQKDFCRKRISSIKLKRKESECNGDDISCISQADSPSMMVDYNSGGIDRKNVSCSLISANSLLVEGVLKTDNVQPMSDCLSGGHEMEEGCKCSNGASKVIKKSLQKNSSFFGKSDASEISLLRDAQTCTSTAERQHSETSMDQVKSSSMRLLTATLKDHQHYALNDAESVKIELEENISTNINTHSDQNEDLAIHQVENEGQFPVEHKPLDCSSGPDVMVDVKVCDICGDAGREDVLAICGKCSDGAEHIYCMQIKLDKVPKGDWMCEECLLLEEAQKQRQNKCEMVVQNLKRSSLDEVHPYAGTLSSASAKTCLGLDIKRPNVAESRGEISSSVSKLSSKRPASNLDSTSVIKRRVLETTVGSTREDSLREEAQLSRKPSFKRNHYIQLSNGKSFENIPEKACLPVNSGCNSPKFQQSFPVLHGALIKSKSFNISDTKLKVELQEDILQKQNFSRNIATSDKKKDGPVRVIRKSLSLNIITPKHLNVADSKSNMFSSKFSHKHVKKLRLEKEHNLVRRKYTSKIDKPSVSSPIAASSVSASKQATKINSCSSETKHLDVKLVQHSRKSCNSLKRAHLLPNERTKNCKGLACTGLVKRLGSCLSDAVHDPSSPMVAAASYEVKLEGECRYNSSMASTGHGDSSDAALQDILLLSQESSNQDEKEQETSYFGGASKHISTGNVFCHHCGTRAHASEFCAIFSSQVPVHGAGSEEDVDRSNQIVLGPKSCSQVHVPTLQANPQPDYIWKGAFEVQDNRKLPSFCYGIQAHLSYQASFKVPEVVKKFPSKLCLEEAPRLSVWPIQFLENHPKEENVALYFYATDVESYGKYKTFLEHMNKYDLALRGNFDGVELLIFSSNVLPRDSKRWNSLFFLWGVFKVRKVDGTEGMPSLQKSTPIPRLNTVLTGQGIRDGNCQTKASCPNQSYLRLRMNFDQRQGRDDRENTVSVSNPIQDKQFCRDMQQPNTVKEDGVNEKWQEDFHPCLKEKFKCIEDSVMSKGNRDNDAEATECLTDVTTPSSSGRCPSDGMLGVKSSEWQLHSLDYENKMKFECLDLELSLGAGKKLSDQQHVPACLEIVDVKNEKGRTSNSVASSTSNDDHADESSVPLELSLALPSYGK